MPASVASQRPVPRNVTKGGQLPTDPLWLKAGTGGGLDPHLPLRLYWPDCLVSDVTRGDEPCWSCGGHLETTMPKGWML